MNQRQWQSHVRAYEKSAQSRRTYTRKHNLNYCQFLYWYRKLTEQTSVSDTPGFVPVDIKPPTATTGNLGVLEFSNGIKLVINSSVLLAQIPGLMEL
ncbi:hypothetical protein MO867_19715 [Microbulbifer sp. OS29]|uniref:Uncharacterized protein n=1 Tax=Microbulbifer okhotskensis TaxID=2926617 RepID=A0A9X2EV84_9GAMM|nr:hypothetical protein [Microbulbifer okhotskensis]MCO1336563.1 hypothetical protein [Microbulbifer okhotskensis]